MSLFDSAKSKINSVVNSVKTVANATINSTTVTYGFIGVSTAILSYYTFFEKDIEVPVIEELTKQNVVEPPAVAEPVPENISNVQPQSGGKKHKKTRKHK
jgi:hypothetical protein